jgi:hypothetical protein
MPLVGFEPAIPASERPQTDTLDRAVTGIGSLVVHGVDIQSNPVITTSVYASSRL